MIPKLTSLRLANFRSFTEERVDFGNLTVLIGPNAAGKSNLLEAILFFRDLAEYGLEDAVSLRGGMDYLRNIGLPKTEDIRLGIDWEEAMTHYSIATPEGIRYPRNLKVGYDIKLSILEQEPVIKSEKLSINYDLYHDQSSIPLEAEYTTTLGVISQSLNSIAENIDGARDTLWYEPSKSLLQQHCFPYIIPESIFENFTKITRYDIDPKLGKSALPITGRTELEEDGDNLPSALKAIVDKPEPRAKLLTLVSDALPFVKQIGISAFTDMTRFMQVEEVYAGKTLPSHLLSDGTIDLIAFIIALYFQKSFLTLFEEPDRNLHPALIRKIAAMLVEQSEHRQLIVTTHNTELINALPRESVLCVARNEEGVSSVFRPSRSPKLQTFLESMGLGQLNADGFLESQ